MEKTEILETDKERLTMQLEDGSEITCQIVMIFCINDQKYIILLPEGSTSQGKGYLMRFAIDEEGGPVLDRIESEDEYAHASEVFRRLYNDDSGESFTFDES